MGGKLPPVVARSREGMRCDGPGPDAFCDPGPGATGPFSGRSGLLNAESENAGEGPSITVSFLSSPRSP